MNVQRSKRVAQEAYSNKLARMRTSVALFEVTFIVFQSTLGCNKIKLRGPVTWRVPSRSHAKADPRCLNQFRAERGSSCWPLSYYMWTSAFRLRSSEKGRGPLNLWQTERCASSPVPFIPAASAVGAEAHPDIT